ncbi:LOW QUALITY PROTEIN: protein TBATA [Neosynchiropus ocellatus]
MSDRRSTPNFRETTGVSSISRKIQGLISPGFSSTDTKSPPRLDGHYSFFSRHNPHPHRVRHIQGLNGRPICTVRDDWNVTSTLFPHPLLKSLHHGSANELRLPANHGHQNKSGWRGELQIAAKVARMKLNTQVQPAAEAVRLKTQYSSQTGRIMPPSTRVSQRRSHSQRVEYRPLFDDPEVMVLEVLCQILQTDSFSAVQQWLLLAGPREKEQVMSLIKDTLHNGDSAGRYNGRRFTSSCTAALPSKSHSRRMKSRQNGAFAEGGPERFGSAEVLSIHKDRFHDEL